MRWGLKGSEKHWSRSRFHGMGDRKDTTPHRFKHSGHLDRLGCFHCRCSGTSHGSQPYVFYILSDCCSVQVDETLTLSAVGTACSGGFCHAPPPSSPLSRWRLLTQRDPGVLRHNCSAGPARVFLTLLKSFFLNQSAQHLPLLN